MQVQPANDDRPAPKNSFFQTLSPRVAFERVALACTEAGMKALRDAAEAERDGDPYGAELLRDAAELLFSDARAVIDEQLYEGAI